jgi:hypothetical protein
MNSVEAIFMTNKSTEVRRLFDRRRLMQRQLKQLTHDVAELDDKIESVIEAAVREAEKRSFY